CISIGLHKMGVAKKIVSQPLLVSKIEPIVTEQSTLVSRVGDAETAQEGFCCVVEPRWIDEFLCYLVEVAAHTFDGRPLCGPFTQVTPLILRSDYCLEMFEDEEELRQLLERLVVVAERGTMAVRSKETIAQSMNSRYLEFREVSCIADLT